MVDDAPLSSFWPGPSPLVVVPNWDDNVYLNRHPSAAFSPHSTINPVVITWRNDRFSDHQVQRPATPRCPILLAHMPCQDRHKSASMLHEYFSQNYDAYGPPPSNHMAIRLSTMIPATTIKDQGQTLDLHGQSMVRLLNCFNMMDLIYQVATLGLLRLYLNAKNLAHNIHQHTLKVLLVSSLTFNPGLLDQL